MDEESFHPIIHKIRKVIAAPAEYPEMCIVEGVRAASLFVHSPYYKLYQWFLTKRMYENLPSFIELPYVTQLSDAVLQSISRVKTPSGLVGIFTRKPVRLRECRNPTFVLYEISDPGNMGTIIRTAVALGRKAIILIGGCHPHSGKVVQATAGTIAQVEVIRTDWQTFMAHRDQKSPLYVLESEGEPLETLQREHLHSCYWVVGNEAHGVPLEICRQADLAVSIPMDSRCESLNAAISAALVGYRSWSIL